MSFTGLDHVGFSVSDLDRSIDWYTRFLDEEPLMRRLYEVEYVGRIVGYPDLRLDAAFWRLPGGTVLELLHYLDPPPGFVDLETYNVGNGHLCLLTDDIQREFERLRSFVDFRSPDPIEIVWGPYRGGAACYLRDPDGISVELLQPPPAGPAL